MSGRNKYQQVPFSHTKPDKLKLRKSTKSGIVALAIVIALLIIAVIFAATQNNHIKADQDGFIAAKLIQVLDGDNIEVEIGGEIEKVKLLLVDAPDSNESMPFGLEATEFLKQSIEGRELKLEKDTVIRGNEQKLPMYVYADGVMLQEVLLENGLAKLVENGKDIKCRDKFREIQTVAREGKIGIWSIDNYVTKDGYDQYAMEKNTKAAELAEAKAKAETEAKAAAEAAKKKQPAKNVYYANCSAVKAAGKAPLYRDEPGYRSALDRDNDGVACE